MKPLNSKERNKLYWQAGLLVTLVVAIITWCLHFDFTLPGALDDQQQQQLIQSAAFSLHQGEILNDMDAIDSEIQLIGTSQDPLTHDAAASLKIAKLGNISSGDSTLSNLLSRVTKGFSEHKAAMLDVHNLNDKIEQLTEQMKTKDGQIQALQSQPKTQF